MRSEKTFRKETARFSGAACAATGWWNVPRSGARLCRGGQPPQPRNVAGREYFCGLRAGDLLRRVLRSQPRSAAFPAPGGSKMRPSGC